MSKMLKVVGASWLQTKISSYILCFLGVLAILALFVGQIERIQEDGTYAATVFYSEKTGYRIEYWGQSNELSQISRGVARAYFRMDTDTIGWSTLEVETDGSYPDEIQAYAAGIVEGALTWFLIHTHLENTITRVCDGTALEKQCDRLKDALDLSANIWKTYASEKEHEDPFWHHVSLYYTQIRGIKTGWEHGVERSLNEFETDISDLYWMNALAEVTELQQKLNISVQDSSIDRLPGLGSAFLTLVNETADDGSLIQKLFVAHNSAGSYSSMMRILKRYKLNYHQTSAPASPPSPGVSVDFASYPGAITSQDEFYVLHGEEHRLAVTGTPLRNYNNKLWKEVNITEQVPVGPRVTAANHLASNASAWGHILARSNSGTGCKQWLVVDYSRFDHVCNYTGLEAPASSKNVVTEISITGRNKGTKHTVVHRGGGGRTRGLLWLVEQVPARTHSADLSDTLIEQGYWATYGLPYFKDIAEITNTTKMQEQYGTIFSEVESPRALAFKRGHKNATSVDSIVKLMWQNNITISSANKTNICPDDDPKCIFDEEGYWAVLGVRGDIVNRFKKAYGVIDTKIVSGITTSKKLEFYAIAGPAYSEVQPKNTSDIPLNKGTVASLYTDQFDDRPAIDGDEIRDLVNQQREDEQQDTLEKINKDAVKPFQWSESDFKTETPKTLPDRWAFETFKPHWAW